MACFHWTQGFHNTFDCGRQAYAIVVDQEKLAIAAGNWAFFEHEELLLLMDGMRLPGHVHRQEFLARLHSNEFGSPTALDVHSRTYQPLLWIDLTAPAKSVSTASS